MSDPHVVEVPCACENIEACVTERYIADVRILLAELDKVKERCNESSQKGL